MSENRLMQQLLYSQLAHCMKTRGGQNNDSETLQNITWRNLYWHQYLRDTTAVWLRSWDMLQRKHKVREQCLGMLAYIRQRPN